MSKKNKVDKIVPNGFAWNVYTTFSKFFIRKQNKTKIDRTVFKERNKKEGCIIIYNHQAKNDHFLTSAAFGSTKVAYVVSSHFYFKPKIRMVLGWVKAISKDQFQNDIATIKKIKRALQHNVPIAIAPTGQMSMHGEQLYMDPSIVKLIKMCKVDVYAAQLHGMYFAYPKWMKEKRKVTTHLNFVKVLNKEDLNVLSEEEMYNRLYDSINIIDRKEVDKYGYNLKPKNLLLGIEDMLYRCPKCGEVDTLSTQDNIITCNKCLNSLKMNSRGVFEANSYNAIVMYDEQVWYTWEKNALRREVENNSLHIEGEFAIYNNIREQYVLENLGNGKVVLTNNEFYYEGMYNGEIKRIDFKMNNLTQLPFETRNHFAIPCEEGTFEFQPINGEKPSKIAQFVQSIELLAAHRKNNSDNE